MKHGGNAKITYDDIYHKYYKINVQLSYLLYYYILQQRLIIR